MLLGRIHEAWKKATDSWTINFWLQLSENTSWEHLLREDITGTVITATSLKLGRFPQPENIWWILQTKQVNLAYEIWTCREENLIPKTESIAHLKAQTGYKSVWAWDAHPIGLFC